MLLTVISLARKIMRFCKEALVDIRVCKKSGFKCGFKMVNIYSQPHAVAKDVLPGRTTSVETPLSINLLARALFQSNKAVFDCPNAFQASYVSPCCIIQLGLSANVVRHTSKLMSSRFTSPNSYPKLPALMILAPSSFAATIRSINKLVNKK